MLRLRFILWLSRKLGIPEYRELHSAYPQSFKGARTSSNGLPTFFDRNEICKAIFPAPTGNFRILIIDDPEPDALNRRHQSAREDNQREAKKFLLEPGGLDSILNEILKRPSL